jgi:hypothetical protein
MTIEDAKRRVVWLWAVGVTLSAVAGVVAVVSFLKGVYFLASSPGANSLIPLGTVLRQIIAEIYPRHAVTIWLWRTAPTFTLDPLLTAGNCGFAFVVAVLLAASQMIGSARHLQNRVKGAHEQAEKDRWRDSLNPAPQQLPPQLVAQAGIMLLQNLQIIPSADDQWYKRPLGIVALAIVGTVIAAAITLMLGLTK